MKKIGIILGISTIHFAICYLMQITSPMALKSDGSLLPFSQGIGRVLFFPLNLFMSNFGTDYVPFSYTAVNSVFWGICIYGFYYWRSSHRRKRTA